MKYIRNITQNNKKNKLKRGGIGRSASKKSLKLQPKTISSITRFLTKHKKRPWRPGQPMHKELEWKEDLIQNKKVRNHILRQVEEHYKNILSLNSRIIENYYYPVVQLESTFVIYEQPRKIQFIINPDIINNEILHYRGGATIIRGDPDAVGTSASQRRQINFYIQLQAYANFNTLRDNLRPNIDVNLFIDADAVPAIYTNGSTTRSIEDTGVDIGPRVIQSIYNLSEFIDGDGNISVDGIDSNVIRTTAGVPGPPGGWGLVDEFIDYYNDELLRLHAQAAVWFHMQNHHLGGGRRGWVDGRPSTGFINKIWNLTIEKSLKGVLNFLSNKNNHSFAERDEWGTKVGEMITIGRASRTNPARAATIADGAFDHRLWCNYVFDAGTTKWISPIPPMLPTHKLGIVSTTVCSSLPFTQAHTIFTPLLRRINPNDPAEAPVRAPPAPSASGNVNPATAYHITPMYAIRHELCMIDANGRVRPIKFTDISNTHLTSRLDNTRSAGGGGQTLRSLLTGIGIADTIADSVITIATEPALTNLENGDGNA